MRLHISQTTYLRARVHNKGEKEYGTLSLTKINSYLDSK